MYFYTSLFCITTELPQRREALRSGKLDKGLIDKSLKKLNLSERHEGEVKKDNIR